MANIVILFPSQENSMKEQSKQIVEALKKLKYKAVQKPALNAQISDVAPADIIIFGNKKYTPEKIHEDYSELMRASSGVNFAGRIIAFFTEDDSESDLLFGDALAETNATVFKAALRMKNNKISSKEITDWVKSLDQFYHKFLEERNV